MMHEFRPTIETMLKDLADAGWKKKLSHIWADRKGKLYLGPYGAWKEMMRRGDLLA